MKKVHISKQRVNRAAAALDEIELAVFGSKTARIRTNIKAGADNLGCKPGQCPVPLYGVTPLDPFEI